MLKITQKMNRSMVFSQQIRKMSKVYENAESALLDLKSGDKVLVGGFGLCGIPQNCIEEMKRRGGELNNLTVVSNNCGVGDWGLGLLLQQQQIKRMIGSYVGENSLLEQQYMNGQIELELVPQGSLAEKLRAGGAGIPGFYTPTGLGTLVETGGFPIRVGNPQHNNNQPIYSEPKERKTFNGKHYILEHSIRGDFGLVKAYKGDKYGNLQFNKSAANFNQEVGSAADITVAEVEHLVDCLSPQEVHLQGIYVKRLFQTKGEEKRIEKLTVQGGQTKGPGEQRERIVKRAVQELHNGMYVNLGIGIPTLIPNYLPKGVQITLQSENGILGQGPYPISGQQHPDLINAGKETVTLDQGGSYFSSSQSFAMIRGQRLDATFLGAMQISSRGDIANWIIPNKLVKGMGGAMDLVSSGSKVVVMMEHQAKGKDKLVEECSLPLTGQQCVDTLITELAVFTFDQQSPTLQEIFIGSTLEEVRAKTGCHFNVSPSLKTFS